MSTHKEIHYLDRECLAKPLFWYSRFFRDAHDRIAEEITPGYSVLEEDRIPYVRRLMPGLRLVYILRNPIDRVWSAARRRLASDGGRSVHDVGVDELARFVKEQPTMPSTYGPMVASSAYLTNIQRWTSIFQPHQLRVELFDDIAADPESLLRNVFRHIRVDETVDLGGFPLHVNTSPRLEMPDELRQVLLDMYGADIEKLATGVNRRVVSWPH